LKLFSVSYCYVLIYIKLDATPAERFGEGFAASISGDFRSCSALTLDQRLKPCIEKVWDTRASSGKTGAFFFELRGIHWYHIQLDSRKTLRYCWVQILYCDKCGLRMQNDEAFKVPSPYAGESDQILCEKCVPAKPHISGPRLKVSSAATLPRIGSSASHPKLGSGANHPKIGSAASHPKIGSAASHPKIGSSVSHPRIGSAATHPKIGSSASHPRSTSSATNSVPRATTQSKRITRTRDRHDTDPNTKMLIMGVAAGVAVLALVAVLYGGRQKPAAENDARHEAAKTSSPNAGSKPLPEVRNEPRKVIDLGEIKIPQDSKSTKGQQADGVSNGKAFPATSKTDELVPKTPLSDLSWRSIFNGTDLSGWKPLKSTWAVKEGCLVNSSAEHASIETLESFTDFEFFCLISMDGKYAEAWVRGANIYPISLAEQNTWIELRAIATGNRIVVTCGGKLIPQLNPPAPGTKAPMHFYIVKPGVLKLKDVRVRALRDGK
jgi:hypothetical protein